MLKCPRQGAAPAQIKNNRDRFAVDQLKEQLRAGRAGRRGASGGTRGALALPGIGKEISGKDSGGGAGHHQAQFFQAGFRHRQNTHDLTFVKHHDAVRKGANLVQIF